MAKKPPTKWDKLATKIKKGSASSAAKIATLKGKPQFFDENGLAKRWATSVSLVRKMRYQGGGPEFTRIGSAVRYKLHDVLIFERANRFKSTSERDPGPKKPL
jgi:hypothetical protein